MGDPGLFFPRDFCLTGGATSLSDWVSELGRSGFLVALGRGSTTTLLGLSAAVCPDANPDLGTAVDLREAANFEAVFEFDAGTDLGPAVDLGAVAGMGGTNTSGEDTFVVLGALVDLHAIAELFDSCGLPSLR